MIKLASLITEALQVVDLRSPEFVDTELMTGKPTSVKAMSSIVGNNIYLFHWGREGNVENWESITSKVGSSRDMSVLTQAGNIILPEYRDNSKWSGKTTVYSDEVYDQLKKYLDAGLISNTSKVYIGNWASRKGTYIGIVQDLLSQDRSQLPNELILYHGTSSDRLENIKKEGLKSVPLEMRTWKSDNLKYHPKYREKAIYLSADKNQAVYYSLKAVKVARRHRIRGTTPVLLKITIPKDKFVNLMPDDDYLQSKYRDQITKKQFPDVSWVESLKNFAQVAYLGEIPPEWIEVESDKAYYSDEPVDEKLKFKPEWDMSEGVRLDAITKKLDSLRKEWERLDSQGTGYERQQQISQEISKLEKEKARWNKLHAAVDESKSILAEKTLYHGTTTNNVSNIKNIGIVPDVGEFVRNAYGYEPNEVDYEDLVFAADKEGLDKAVTAITAQVAYKLGKDFHDVTDDEFIRNGALIKIEDGDIDLEYRPKDDEKGEYPFTVEPGDYYSRGSVHADEILTGNKMITVLKRYKAWPRTYGPDKIKGMKYSLIRLAVKKNPGKPPRQIASIINKWDNRTIEQYYYKNIHRSGYQ